jgi:hypothetical protein
MAGRLQLEADEKVLKQGSLYTLQGGGRMKFPVNCRYVLTNRRFFYWDLGRWAPFHSQMGLIFLLMVRGKPVGMPLDGLRLSRGTYGMNKKLALISATDGTSLLADRLEKVVELFREPLGTAGIGLTQTAAEEWQIRTGW